MARVDGEIGCRIEASIVEWEFTEVLTVPGSALFRVGDEWAVFVIVINDARMVRIKPGKRNDNDTEVVQGLKESDRAFCRWAPEHTPLLISTKRLRHFPSELTDGGSLRKMTFLPA